MILNPDDNITPEIVNELFKDAENGICSNHVGSKSNMYTFTVFDKNNKDITNEREWLINSHGQLFYYEEFFVNEKELIPAGNEYHYIIE